MQERRQRLREWGGVSVLLRSESGRAQHELIPADWKTSSPRPVRLKSRSNGDECRQSASAGFHRRHAVVHPARDHDHWNEGAWESTGRFTLAYDAENWLGRVALQMIILGWMDTLVETYTYEAGLLREIVMQLSLGGFGMQNLGRALLDWTAPSATAIPSGMVPETGRLTALYPNPFSLRATVQYQVGEATHVRIVVFDALGRLVTTLTDKFHSAGTYEVGFSAADHRSGTYLVRLETPTAQQSRMVSLLR